MVLQVTEAVPTSVLQDRHPPDTYGELILNWEHPRDLCTNWCKAAVNAALRAIDRESQEEGYIVPLPMLVVLPSMNGLPTPPRSFEVRSI